MLEIGLDQQNYSLAKEKLSSVIEGANFPEIARSLTEGLEVLARLAGVIPDRENHARIDAHLALTNVLTAGGNISMLLRRPDFKIWKSVPTGMDEYTNQYPAPPSKEILTKIQEVQEAIAVGLSYASRPLNLGDRKDFISSFREAIEKAKQC